MCTYHNKYFLPFRLRQACRKRSRVNRQTDRQTLNIIGWLPLCGFGYVAGLPSVSRTMPPPGDNNNKYNVNIENV